MMQFAGLGDSGLGQAQFAAELARQAGREHAAAAQHLRKRRVVGAEVAGVGAERVAGIVVLAAGQFGNEELPQVHGRTSTRRAAAVNRAHGAGREKRGKPPRVSGRLAP